MNPRVGLLALLAAGMLSVAADRSSANQLTNGSFESPIVAAGNFLDIGPGQETADGFLGWTVTTGNVDVVNATLPIFGINWGAQATIDGNQILDLNGFVAGGIAQSFPTVSGQSYSVEFWYANNPLGPGGSAQVDVLDVGTTNNTLLTDSIAHNTSTLTVPDWQMFGSSFVAQGPLSSFAIVSTSNPNDASGGVVLDAINVKPVPEPATVLLGLVAICALAGRRLARRR